MNAKRTPPQRAGASLVLLVLALVLGSCASMGIGGSDRNTTLIVVNNLEEAHTLEIFLNPAVGPRYPLGTVPPGRTASLQFPAPAEPTDRVQFIAEAGSGGEFARATTPMAVDQGGTIVWNVDENEAFEVEPL